MNCNILVYVIVWLAVVFGIKGAVRQYCLQREAVQAHDFTACEIINVT